MPEREMPERGEVWVKRKSGERFEVWAAYPRWIVVYPLLDGNRRPIHVITNNFTYWTPNRRSAPMRQVRQRAGSAGTDD